MSKRYSTIISGAIFMATLFASTFSNNALAQISIVPKPVSVKATGDDFKIDEKTIISVDKQSLETADYLVSILQPSTGFPLKIEELKKGKAPIDSISLIIDSSLEKSLGSEGYRLVSAKSGVEITSADSAGLFYGIQTLRQLLPVQVESKTKTDADWTVPGVTIEDMPRFKWRGLMLDVARHFQPKEFVLGLIDDMALFKMNTLHFHLVDDQGWRIEIKKYPELTKIGAWREKSKASEAFMSPSGKAHGGFYTQDDIREIVAYAAKRHITIVPEIEMPGHAQAAIASRNELSCTGKKLKVLTHWGVNKEVFCAGNEEVFRFLEGVLAEVAQLFPGEYIHVGGDEVPKDRWKECPKCQARIKAEGLKDEAELQSYFIKRMERFLASIGKKLIGWDEILEGGLPPRASVMSWRGITGGIAAASEGHDVVMSPTSHCYFDYRQSEEKEPNPVGAPIATCKVYSFEPVPDVLPAEKAKHILGAQGNLWTEHIEKPDHALYMFFPRAIALSEVNWTRKDLKDYKDFKVRMTSIYPRLDVLGIQYRPPRDTDDSYCDKK